MVIRPAFGALPALWRLLQCLRVVHDKHNKWQIINAGKYATSILVSVSSVLHGTFPSSIALLVLWIVVVSCGTLYSFTWDIYFDWGLGRHKAKNPLLRDVLMFKHTPLYYFMMGANLLLRLAWTLTISPEAIGVGVWVNPEAFKTLIATLEICRRGMWNVLRVENEHISNCYLTRASRTLDLKDISLQEGNYYEFRQL
eukprot:TRINITY_DN1610_c0_g1_i3.p1 TRINITY_DN1610_c0_g1~~TRINITY_DN1610_c0_g1_i3.p1  ORF type:complete len:198 (+),score=33.44 TRINITY_DN1610_c0_g1_i3:52-645(+)